METTTTRTHTAPPSALGWWRGGRPPLRSCRAERMPRFWRREWRWARMHLGLRLTRLDALRLLTFWLMAAATGALLWARGLDGWSWLTGAGAVLALSGLAQRLARQICQEDDD